MAISKPIRKKKNEKWIAGALVFSGRPDPTWPVNKRMIKELDKVWNSLERTASDKFPTPPILGYRGYFVRENNTNHEWYGYKDVVILQRDGSSESRIDRQGKFQTLLLSSAPPGILPDYCLKHRED